MAISKISGAILFVATLLVFSAAAGAITLKLVSESDSYEGKPVKTYNSFIGLIGDTVALDDGDYTLYFPVDNGYVLRTGISVQGEAVTVKHHSAAIRHGRYLYEVDWPQPSISKPEEQPVWVLTFPEAQFVRQLERYRQPALSLAGCTQRKVILTVTSSPSNAEIWIGGSKVAASTDTTLSVPFCSNESLKYVTVRADGHINCLQQFGLAPNRKVSVACTLTPLADLSDR